MRANLVILKSSLIVNGELENYDASLGELILTRELALGNKDNIYKPGGWDTLVLNEIIETLDLEDRIIVPRIIQKLKILFNEKSFALYQDPLSIEELNEFLTDRPNGFLGIHFAGSANHFVSDRPKWYVFHRDLFVANPPTIERFCLELSPYFENIFFNEQSIRNYLDTLHCRSHAPIMKTIIHHLSALNDKFYDLFIQYRTEGLPRVCIRFQGEMDTHPIPFGCSVDVDNIGSLEIEFTDPVSGETRNLYCDPHTKIWDYLEDGIDGHKGDRIYFYQPLDDFISGKILVGRIGGHR